MGNAAAVAAAFLFLFDEKHAFHLVGLCRAGRGQSPSAILCVSVHTKSLSCMQMPGKAGHLHEKSRREAALFHYMRAKARLFLWLVGRAGFLDFLEQVLLRIVEQQALVVRKVGFAAEILDEPRGEVVRGQLGCK